jgi:hypothetical protein
LASVGDGAASDCATSIALVSSATDGVAAASTTEPDAIRRARPRTIRSRERRQWMGCIEARIFSDAQRRVKRSAPMDHPF